MSYVIDDVKFGEHIRNDEIHPRYVRQKDSYSCGPIMVANALKWAGRGFNYGRDGEWLRRSMGCTREWGTEEVEVTRALNILGREYFDVAYRKKINLRQIKHILKSGGAVGILFGESEEQSHYALAVRLKVQRGWYVGLVNLGMMKSRALEYISGDKFVSRCLGKLEAAWILRGRDRTHWRLP